MDANVSSNIFQHKRQQKKNLRYARTAFVLSSTYLEDAKIGESTTRLPVVYLLLEVAVYRPTPGEQRRCACVKVKFQMLQYMRNKKMLVGFNNHEECVLCHVLFVIVQAHANAAPGEKILGHIGPLHLFLYSISFMGGVDFIISSICETPKRSDGSQNLARPRIDIGVKFRFCVNYPFNTVTKTQQIKAPSAMWKSISMDQYSSKSSLLMQHFISKLSCLLWVGGVKGCEGCSGTGLNNHDGVPSVPLPNLFHRIRCSPQTVHVLVPQVVRGSKEGPWTQARTLETVSAVERRYKGLQAKRKRIHRCKGQTGARETAARWIINAPQKKVRHRVAAWRTGLGLFLFALSRVSLQLFLMTDQSEAPLYFSNLKTLILCLKFLLTRLKNPAQLTEMHHCSHIWNNSYINL